MDRNIIIALAQIVEHTVALLAEGVDRNIIIALAQIVEHTVALLAEGVDRNWSRSGYRRAVGVSPSSRRAWIEIRKRLNSTAWTLVALLAEGVDRNQSPLLRLPLFQVALLAEGVDRNSVTVPIWLICASPSSRRAWIEILLPRLIPAGTEASPSSRRAWIEIPVAGPVPRKIERRPPRGGRG